MIQLPCDIHGTAAGMLDVISGTHVRSSNDTKLSPTLGKLPQLIYYQPKSAPLDERHEYIDLVG